MASTVVIGTAAPAGTGGVCIGEGETLRQAGHRMRELGVGLLPVRGDDGELYGTISVEDVLESIAAGNDPKTLTVGEVARCA